MNTWDELRTVFEKQLISFGELKKTPAVLLTSMLIILNCVWDLAVIATHVAA